MCPPEAQEITLASPADLRCAQLVCPLEPEPYPFQKNPLRYLPYLGALEPMLPCSLLSQQDGSGAVMAHGVRSLSTALGEAPSGGSQRAGVPVLLLDKMPLSQ